MLTSATERKLRRCDDCAPEIDEGLYESLREWRTETAREIGMPAFVVLTDATLLALAESMPEGPEDLLKVPGIGAAKMRRHGEDILSVLSQFR